MLRQSLVRQSLQFAIGCQQHGRFPTREGQIHAVVNGMVEVDCQCKRLHLQMPIGFNRISRTTAEASSTKADAISALCRYGSARLGKASMQPVICRPTAREGLRILAFGAPLRRLRPVAPGHAELAGRGCACAPAPAFEDIDAMGLVGLEFAKSALPPHPENSLYSVCMHYACAGCSNESGLGAWRLSARGAVPLVARGH